MTTPKEGAGLLERLAGGIDDALAARRELNALAPDHALLLRALAIGRAQILGGELFLFEDDDEEADATLNVRLPIDAAGCPALTPELRSALRKVVGSNG